MAATLDIRHAINQRGMILPSKTGPDAARFLRARSSITASLLPSQFILLKKYLFRTIINWKD
jgi:hypothetical protein